MTAADHENTIRNGLLPKDAHHRYCRSNRGADCDCYYSLRRDGKVAHEALDALLSEREREREQHAEEMRQARSVAETELRFAHRKLYEARAENERRAILLRQIKQNAESWHGPEGLDTVIVEWIEADENGGAHPSVAALAAAQEPPASAMEFCWLIERGQAEGQVPTVWLDTSTAHAGWYGDWTTDAWKATRYASREEAEEVVERLFRRLSVCSARAVEHGFAAQEPPADPRCTCRAFHGAKNCPVHGYAQEPPAAPDDLEITDGFPI